MMRASNKTSITRFLTLVHFVEYFKDTCYAMFHGPSCHRYKENHISILLELNSDKVNGTRNEGRVCQ